jgi:hypothetical protein
MSVEQRLLNLKDKIETAKSDKARAEGALAQLQARLAEEFNVNDVDAAEDLLEKLRAETAELEKKIEASVIEMEAKYGL